MEEETQFAGEDIMIDGHQKGKKTNNVFLNKFKKGIVVKEKKILSYCNKNNIVFIITITVLCDGLQA